MPDKLTDNEIVKALKSLEKDTNCGDCAVIKQCKGDCVFTKTLNLINRKDQENESLKAEVERLKEEVSKTRRNALLEASSKFAGHSDYHGDTILCKLICMAEGKGVKSARPLDKAEIKAEAYKECIEKVKEKSKKTEIVCSGALVTISYAISNKNLDNLLKELAGE